MEAVYVKLAGEMIQPASLSNPKALDLLQAVIDSEFCDLKCVLKAEGGRKIVIFDTVVEVPQYPPHDIRKIERMAVILEDSDDEIPKVLCLREDFPSLPHQMLELFEIPKSLCLYNISYDEVKIFWTGFNFVERIREWLKLSAVGQLHQNDQPLEPIITGEEGTILIHTPFREGEDIFIYTISTDYYGRPTFFASSGDIRHHGQLFKGILGCLRGEPQVHGIISKKPTNLEELHELLTKAKLNIKDFIIERFKEYKSQGRDLKQRLMLYVELPKARSRGEDAIQWESFMFITADTIDVIGRKLDLWDDMNVGMGVATLIGSAFKMDAFATTQIGILKPVYPLTRELSNYINGVDLPNVARRMIAVGAGALGSQLLINLIRAGIGTFLCLDADIFLPHNLSRNALLGYSVMQGKAEAVAFQLNTILPGSARWQMLDLVREIDSDAVRSELSTAEVILDLSASTAVSKALANVPVRGRVCSLFTNPRGNDFVAIGEDEKGEYMISELEFQYLRRLMNTPELYDHFSREEEIRYGTGCRDLSLVLPQDSIALSAALGSKWIKQFIQSKGPMVSIWRTDPETLAVHHYAVEVFKPCSVRIGEWTVCLDDYLTGKISNARKERLPNETGGILIGSYDMSRKLVYQVEVIHSPEDSMEYPTAYIRGIKDIGRKLSEISKITAGALQYVGEWHTHPDGSSTGMSADDLVLFAWLKGNMRKEGLPALMLIAGERDEISLYVC